MKYNNRISKNNKFVRQHIKSTEFRTKSSMETNDQSRGGYNTNNDIRFKTTVLKSSLFDHSVAYILVKIRITITRVGNRRADEKKFSK